METTHKDFLVYMITLSLLYYYTHISVDTCTCISTYMLCECIYLRVRWCEKIYNASDYHPEVLILSLLQGPNVLCGL